MTETLSWDEVKRRATLKDRSLDFADADLFFDGRPNVHQATPRHGEARVKTTALIGDRFFTLVWLRRERTIHVISLRRAHAKEIRTYREIHLG